jgi:hypothetical protein
MERGYVKLWRKCLDSGLIQNGPAWQLFGYLLLKTTHRPHRQIVGGMVFNLQPGEVVFGRVKAAADLGLSEKQVRTAFDLLKKLEIVASRSTNRCTVVSFVNWHRYQDERPAEGQPEGQPQGQQTASNGPAEGQQRATNKNVRTKKEERKTDTSYLAQSDAGASSAQLAAERERPAVFIPLADGTEYPVPVSLACEYAAAYPGVNVMGEFGKARAWCLSNPRQRKTKSGIRRFLNGWMDRAQNNASRGSPASPGRPMTARQMEAAERGDFAEQVLKLDEVYRNGELAAFGSGTEQGVRALSAAEARTGGIRTAGQDVG